MRIEVADAALARALGGLGSSGGRAEDGVVFGPARVTTWAEAEEELTRAYRLAHAAAQENAPVVFVVDAAAAVGRGAPLDAAVAVGLVAGGRCLAFEGLRKDEYASVIGYDGAEPPSRVAATVEFLVATGVGRGQTVMVGSAHVGAMLP